MDKAALQRTQEQLQHLRRKGTLEKGRTLAIPTIDLEVRRWLRLLGEPVTRFGEGPWDRRERLRRMLAEHPEPQNFIAKHTNGNFENDPNAQSTRTPSHTPTHSDRDEFWVPGSKELLLPFRKVIQSYTKDKILKRQNEGNKKIPTCFAEKQQLIEATKYIHTRIKKITLSSSEVFDGDAPLGACEIVKNDIIIGDNDGFIRRLVHPLGLSSNGNDSYDAMCDSRNTEWKLNSKISCINGSRGASGVFAVSDFSGSIGIVNSGLKKMSPLPSESSQRVPRLQFHPLDAYLASSSADGTWRLWDLHKEMELQWQEGHSKGGVYGIDFHCDGSIVSTGGIDGLVRLWDCRIGKCIWSKEKKSFSVYDVTFHPDGTNLCCSLSNGTIVVWDVRKMDVEQQVLPASSQSSIISSMKFVSIGGGAFDAGAGYNSATNTTTTTSILVTGSFDKSMKVWNTSSSLNGWTPLIERNDHSGRITSVAANQNGLLCSSSTDKTLKVYSF